MSIWTAADAERTAHELRTLLDGGTPLAEAIVVLHRDRRLGVMHIWPAVVAATGASRQDAMRAVVTATHNLHWGPNGEAAPDA
jgi:hypothetical protein